MSDYMICFDEVLEDILTDLAGKDKRSKGDIIADAIKSYAFFREQVDQGRVILVAETSGLTRAVDLPTVELH